MKYAVSYRPGDDPFLEANTPEELETKVRQAPDKHLYIIIRSLTPIQAYVVRPSGFSPREEDGEHVAVVCGGIEKKFSRWQCDYPRGELHVVCDPYSRRAPVRRVNLPVGDEYDKLIYRGLCSIVPGEPTSAHMLVHCEELAGLPVGDLAAKVRLAEDLVDEKILSRFRETTIHVLHGGRPLCGFSQEVPAKWPKGHIWVALEISARSNCPGCRQKAEARHAQARCKRA